MNRVEPELRGATKNFEFAYKGVIFLPAKVLHANIVLSTTMMIIFMLCVKNVTKILLTLYCERSRNERSKKKLKGVIILTRWKLFFVIYVK